MNEILIATVLGMLYKIVSGFAVLPQLNTAEKTFQSDITYQSIHAALQSIESRIQNLESTLSMQHTTLVEGKLEYYGRKIENIEKDVSRFEAHSRIEMDKILENIGNKNFKDDIVKDRTIRKIDGIYERLSHKLTSIEGQIDVTNIKSQNGREMIISKLEKIEENLTIRDGDMEAEIADAIAAIDDLKSTCTNMEENLLNVTRDSLKAITKINEKSAKKHLTQTITIIEDVGKNITSDIVQLQKTVDRMFNQSLDTYSKMNSSKADLDESMNEYANKITDMYFDLWKKTETMDATIKNLAVITNITRNEQQNGLRALMVQVGRKTPKNVQSDTVVDNQKLTELMKKVDSNFESVMMAQNLFLESCHRVQMDESQLESQISVVLEKLIDTFENKTVVGPKDIRHLEHLIRNHDANIKKSIYLITSHLLNLIQKNSDNKDEIVDYIKSQLMHLEALHMMVHDALDSERASDILHELQVLQQTINKTQESLEHTSDINFYITKMLNSSETNTKLDEVLEYVKNISHVLNSIETKIDKSYLHLFFNNFNTEVVAQQINKRLESYIRWMLDSDKTDTPRQENITQILLEIFDTKPYNNSYRTNQVNSLEESDVIEKVVLLCNNDPNCDEIHTTQYKLIKQSNVTHPQNTSENKKKYDCLPTYVNEIDVRSNFQNCSTNLNTIDQNSTNEQSNIGLPDYAELTDSSSRTPSNCSLNTLTEANTQDTLSPMKNNTKASPVHSNSFKVTSNYSLNCTRNVGNIKDGQARIISHTLDSRTQSNKNRTLPNYTALIDVRSSNSYESDGADVVAELDTNSSNHKNSTVSEVTSTLLTGVIRPAGIIQEEATYSQIETSTRDFETITPDTAVDELIFDNNAVSTIFEEVENPD